MRYQRAELPLKLDGVDAATRFFAGCFADADPGRESLWVAYVDEAACCLHLSRHEGLQNGVDLPIRSILAEAAILGSAGILLAHNHPSGDPNPSEADRRSTRRLACAADAMNCTVLDHLVFAGDRCTSFRRTGLL